MIRNHYICDLCGAETSVEGPNLPNAPVDIPEDWIQRAVTAGARALDPRLDGMARALSNLPPDVAAPQVAFLEASQQPFQTFIDVCAACQQAHLPRVHEIVTERLRERTEENAEKAAGLHVVDPDED